MNPSSIFDQAKQTDLLTVARQAGLKLVRAGGDRWKMCCPVHSEKTPSCVLHGPKAGRYANQVHCYGCGWHGSVVDFYAAIQGIEPTEAARLLAGPQADLPKVAYIPSNKQTEVPATLGEYADLYAAFLAWCKGYGQSPQKRAVLRYLQGRGLSPREISQAALFAVPDDRAAQDWLRLQPQATQAGLLTRGGAFALAGYPLLFPSYGPQGRCMVLQGRKTDPATQGPKYRFLAGVEKYPYGGHTLTDGRGPVYLVEGAFDAIGLAIIEAAPCLAMGGLSVSQSLLELLGGRPCILVTDNDPAGKRERGKLADKLKANGIQVRQGHLPPALKDAGAALLDRPQGKLEAMKAANPQLGRLMQAFNLKPID